MVRPGRLVTIVVLWALAEDDELAPDETRPLELIEERSSKLEDEVDLVLAVAMR